MKRDAIITALIVVSLLLFFYSARYQPFFCRGSGSCKQGVVERVIDGDTLIISNITVRLALVSAPEKHEDGGLEAFNFTAALCPAGANALIDEDDGQREGSYGRLVGVVWCNGKNLNKELIDADFARLVLSFCKKSEFRNEKWAKGC